MRNRFAQKIGCCRGTSTAKDRACGWPETGTMLAAPHLLGPCAMGITSAGGLGRMRGTGNCAILASDEIL
jgi:hypothetical protein